MTDAMAGEFEFSLESLWVCFSQNMTIYLWSFFESHLYPFPTNSLNDAYHLMSTLLCLAGLTSWLRRSFMQLLPWFAASFLGLLLIAPTYGTRYLWPLYLLFSCGLASGTNKFLERTTLRYSRARAPRYTLLPFTLLAVRPYLSEASRQRTQGLMEHPDVAPLLERLGEISAETPLRATFIKPRVLTWETGIPCHGYVCGIS
jgi:hypothetical protein